MNLRKLLLTLLLTAGSLFSFGQTSNADSIARLRADKADSMFALHLRKNKFDSATFYARRSLVLRRKTSDKAGTVQSLLNLGEVFERQNKKKDALDFFRTSALTAKTVNDPALRKKSYDRLIVALKKADNYKEAYFYQVQVTKLNDSVSNALMNQRLREQSQLHKTLQATKNESETRIIEQQKELEKLNEDRDNIQLQFENYRQLTLYAFIALGVLVLALLVARFAARRKLTKEIKRQQLKENERVVIAKDIRNEFDLELSRINDLSQELFYRPAGPELKKQLNSIVEISSKLLLDVRDLVWSVNGSQATLKELIKHVNTYSDEYFREFSIEVISRNPDNLPDLQMPKPVFRTIFVVLKEIFFQLAKQSKPMNVYLNFSLVDNRLNITVHDDGIGLQYDPDNREDWYQRLKTRLQSAGGLLSVTKEELGNRFRLDIQLSELVKK